MRELIVQYGALAVSAATIIATVMVGRKARSAWLWGLGAQAVWVVYICATAQWGLMPSWAALCMVYAFNHVMWEKQRDTSNELALGWVSANAEGDMYRCWDMGPAWTNNPDQALHFVRREDAESFSEDDEDAWRVLRHGVRLTAMETEHRRMHPGQVEELRRLIKTQRVMSKRLRPSEPWPRR